MGRGLRVIVALALLALASDVCSAQNEYAVWYFGSRAGIDFRTSPPTPVVGPLNSWEGSTVLCNGRTGDVLLSTDGDSVYNRDGRVMPNGRGIEGHHNSTQCALALPKPGERVLIYLVTSDAGTYVDAPNTGIHYSIVDMTLDSGRGDVTTKNVPLLPVATEMLCAVRRPDSCSYWIIAHGWENNNFYAWRLDDKGIDPTPVITSIGSVHHDPPLLVGTGGAMVSYLKASSDGSRLAVVGYSDSIVEVFSFDRVTGVLSSPISLLATGLDYGISFSPDASRLYVSSSADRSNGILPTLVQYDLTAGDIPASRTEIYRDNVASNTGALQLGPDGRIYHARFGNAWLGVINNPNALGTACNYQADGFRIASPPSNSTYGLPTLVESMSLLQGSQCNVITAAFTPVDTTVCAGTCVQFTDRSSNDPVAWQWNALSATQGTSTEQNPVFCFEQAGRYPVTLIASNGPSSDTVVQWVTITSSAEISTDLTLNDSAGPGDHVPLTVDVQQRPASVGRIYRVTLDLGANGRLRLDSVGLDPAIAADMVVDSIVFDRATNRWTAILRWNGASAGPPDGQWLRASGTTAITSDDSAVVVCRISSIDAAGCVSARPDSGQIRVTVCGLQYRLIESIGAKYLLEAPLFDRADGTLTVRGSLGLDGPLTLELFDPSGRRVLDEQALLPSGTFERRFEAAKMATGVYLLRVQSGDWSRSATVRIVR